MKPRVCMERVKKPREFAFRFHFQWREIFSFFLSTLAVALYDANCKSLLRHFCCLVGVETPTRWFLKQCRSWKSLRRKITTWSRSTISHSFKDVDRRQQFKALSKSIPSERLVSESYVIVSVGWLTTRNTIRHCYWFALRNGIWSNQEINQMKAC